MPALRNQFIGASADDSLRCAGSGRNIAHEGYRLCSALEGQYSSSLEGAPLEQTSCIYAWNTESRACPYSVMFQREYGSNNSEPSFASFAVAVCLISPFTLFEKAFFDFQTGSVTDAHYQILQPSLKWKLTPLAFYFSLPRFCFRYFRLQCFIMSKRFFFLLAFG